MSRRQVRCIEARCAEIARARGMCWSHYSKARREGTLPPITPKAAPVQAPPSPSPKADATKREAGPCDRCGVDLPAGTRILHLCRDCLAVVRGSDRLVWAA